MPSKYPDFDRITPGRLTAGDRLLVRSNKRDGLRLVGGDRTGSEWQPDFLPEGIHTIIHIGVQWDTGRVKASRYYLLTVDHHDPRTQQNAIVRLSASNKVNRVVAT